MSDQNKDVTNETTTVVNVNESSQEVADDHHEQSDDLQTQNGAASQPGPAQAASQRLNQASIEEMHECDPGECASGGELHVHAGQLRSTASSRAAEDEESDSGEGASGGNFYVQTGHLQSNASARAAEDEDGDEDLTNRMMRMAVIDEGTASFVSSEEEEIPAPEFADEGEMEPNAIEVPAPEFADEGEVEPNATEVPEPEFDNEVEMEPNLTGIYNCPQAGCNKEFKGVNTLIKHAKDKHNLTIRVINFLPCPSLNCSFQYETEKDLNEHNRKKHR